MKRLPFLGLLFGLSLLAYCGMLFASEANELRKKALAIKKEAALLAERGNTEEAEHLFREAKRLFVTADQLDSKESYKHADQLRKKLQDLQAMERKLRETKIPEAARAEIRENIIRTQRELDMIQMHAKITVRPEFREHAEKLDVATRRIHHLRVAAQNLKMAEANDLAAELMKRAEAMEREVHEARKRLTAEIQKARGPEPGEDIVRELRAEVERLRAEVRELRQRLERR